MLATLFIFIYNNYIIFYSMDYGLKVTGKEKRIIDGNEFEIVYGMHLGNFIAKVYKDGIFCFDIDGEYDTDVENDYIRCWNELEDC